jgi:N-acetyl-anhydromuramyl-L-alanine amidase AmpD
VKGSEILKTLPAEGGQKREAAILDHVRAGHYVPPCWSRLALQHGGHEGSVLVASDAFKLGEHGDCFRVNVSAATAQRIADELGCLLPTTKLCDEVFRQATARGEPSLQPADPTERARRGYSPCMMDTQAMLRHDREVTAKLGGQAGLACNVGKHWSITNYLLGKDVGVAANYGLYTSGAPYRSPSGLLMWQTLGFRHQDSYTDYSQVLRLVRTEMLLGAERVSIHEVGRDPEVSGLVTEEGVMKLFRMPGVPAEGGEPSVPVEPLPADLQEFDFRRLLRLRSPWLQGDDVKQWQQFLRIAADGKFGPQTDAATRAFQASHRDPATGKRLVADGIVGGRTVAAANQVLGRTAEYEERLVSDFAPAKHFTNVDRTSELRHIVIHTAESAEVFTAAEALAAWVSGPNAPRASWHYAVDADSITQSVEDRLVAWHAPGANRSGIGIELAGRAKQSALEWKDDFSQATLERAARLVAYLCKKWSIPVRSVSRAGLIAGDAGITTHNEVTHAFGKSTHTDPGEHFPMDWFVGRVKALGGE